MNDENEGTRSTWSSSASAKAKTAVQRSVTALLDDLAPERVLTRVERVPGAVEQHRTPTGCVLQAADCAVSVSWFAAAEEDSPLGELHVLVWQGKVTRRGASPVPKGAKVIADMVLRPIQPAQEDACVWLGPDGTRYDTASLTAKCLSLLEAQVRQG